MLRTVSMYRLHCDWLACPRTAEDDTDHYAWVDAESAVEDAMNAGWWHDTRHDRWYCDDHPAIWKSDIDAGTREAPEPPYLLLTEDDDDPVRLIPVNLT